MRALRILGMVIAVGAFGAMARAQDEFPTQLHTIRTAGVHEVSIGDVVQVRYRAQAVANGIGNIRAEVRGASLRKIATVTAPLDPTQQQQPGAPYFVIVMFKAERAGDSLVKVTPLRNDGTADVSFPFTARVLARP